MIKRLAIAVELLLALAWMFLFTLGLDLLSVPSDLAVAAGAVVILGGIVLFPTLMKVAWSEFNYSGNKEKKNEEAVDSAVDSGRAAGPDRLRHDSH